MDLGISGKTIIVTGGSGGIGRGVVLEFAAEGANVASIDRDPGDELLALAQSRGLSGRIVPVVGDITTRSGAEAAIAQARQHFGPVSVLINNAGGGYPPEPFETITTEHRDWEKALNIDGVVNCCLAVAPDMLTRGDGSIINIASHAAVLAGSAVNMVHYGSVKGFIVSLSKALAWEWGGKGVRVNAVAPGWIVPHDSADVGPSSFWSRFGFDLMGSPQQMQTALETGTLFNIANLPIKRLGRPEDIARLALFLASERSSYITGQLISVGGGAYMP